MRYGTVRYCTVLYSVLVNKKVFLIKNKVFINDLYSIEIKDKNILNFLFLAFPPVVRRGEEANHNIISSEPHSPNFLVRATSAYDVVIYFLNDISRMSIRKWLAGEYEEYVARTKNYCGRVGFEPSQG